MSQSHGSRRRAFASSAAVNQVPTAHQVQAGAQQTLSTVRDPAFPQGHPLPEHGPDPAAALRPQRPSGLQPSGPGPPSAARGDSPLCLRVPGPREGLRGQGPPGGHSGMVSAQQKHSCVRPATSPRAGRAGQKPRGGLEHLCRPGGGAVARAPPPFLAATPRLTYCQR